jgi:hypothetical protein
MKNMKQKLVVLALFILNFTNAQNVDFLKKANKCDIDFARQFSDSIAKNCKTKFVFLDKTESEWGKSVTMVYVPENTSKEDIESTKAYMSRSERIQFFECENCLCVYFRTKNEGENKDLEIAGVKKYSFFGVNGKFLDLFPFWKKNIEPMATTDKVTTGIYSIRDNQKKIWYYFKKADSNGVWDLVNMTDRFENDK